MLRVILELVRAVEQREQEYEGYPENIGVEMHNNFLGGFKTSKKLFF